MEFTMPSIAASTRTTLGRGLLTLFSAGFDPSGGGAAPGTYGQMPAAPPPQKSKFWLYLLGGCGCGVILLVACCGGLPFAGLYFSNKVVAQALRQEVEGNAQVQEHLGEIQSLNMNIMETGAEKSKRGGTANWVVV